MDKPSKWRKSQQGKRRKHVDFISPGNRAHQFRVRAESDNTPNPRSDGVEHIVSHEERIECSPSHDEQEKRENHNVVQR